MISAGHVRADRPSRRDLIEDSGALAEIVEFQWIEAHVCPACCRLVGGDRDQPSRITVRKRTQEHGIDKSEDCGGRECWLLPQDARGKLQVLKHRQGPPRQRARETLSDGKSEPVWAEWDSK